MINFSKSMKILFCLGITIHLVSGMQGPQKFQIYVDPEFREGRYQSPSQPIVLDHIEQKKQQRSTLNEEQSIMPRAHFYGTLHTDVGAIHSEIARLENSQPFSRSWIYKKMCEQIIREKKQLKKVQSHKNLERKKITASDWMYALVIVENRYLYR